MSRSCLLRLVLGILIIAAAIASLLQKDLTYLYPVPILLILVYGPVRLGRQLLRAARTAKFWLVVAVLGAMALNAVSFLRCKLPRISLAAEEVTRIGGFRITNTLIASWVTMAVLLVVAVLATRRMQLVPRGLQNVIEFVIESLYNLTQSTTGSHAALVFPTIATLFLFIVVSNWMGLLPGYLSVTVAQAAGHGGEVEHVSLLRSATTDLNTTLALAIASVFMSQVYGVIVGGFPRYSMRYLNIRRFVAFFKGVTGKGPWMGLSSLFYGGIDLFIGVLEFFDEFIKIMSFAFRLFGNIFAGEVLLGVMVFLVPFVASLPFLGLELFVGFIQAFVFAILSAAFIAQATALHGAEAEAHGEHVSPLAEVASPAMQGS